MTKARPAFKNLQAQIIRLQPRDILVIRTPEMLRKDGIKAMREYVDQQLAKAGINFPVGVIYAVGDVELYLKSLQTILEDNGDTPDVVVASRLSQGYQPKVEKGVIPTPPKGGSGEVRAAPQ